MSESIFNLLTHHNQKQIKYKIVNDCWICTSHSVTNTGYIRCHRDGFDQMHRWLHYKITGEKPENVMHKCNNPKCINPDHLVGGTHRQNMIDAGNDMLLKSNRRKLTNWDIKFIKYWLSKKYTLKEIANKFKVSYSTIKQIKDNITYKEVQI